MECCKRAKIASVSEDLECGICSEDTSSLMTLQCGHQYHQSCLERWWRRSRITHNLALWNKVQDVRIVQERHLYDHSQLDKLGDLSFKFCQGVDRIHPRAVEMAEGIEEWTPRCCLCTLRVISYTQPCSTCGSSHNAQISNTRKTEPLRNLKLVTSWEQHEGQDDPSFNDRPIRLETMCTSCVTAAVDKWAGVSTFSFRDFLETDAQRQQYDRYRSLRPRRSILDYIPFGGRGPNVYTMPQLAAMLDNGAKLGWTGHPLRYRQQTYVNNRLRALRDSISRWNQCYAFCRGIKRGGTFLRGPGRDVLTRAYMEDVDDARVAMNYQFRLIWSSYSTIRWMFN